MSTQNKYLGFTKLRKKFMLWYGLRVDSVNWY